MPFHVVVVRNLIMFFILGSLIVLIFKTKPVLIDPRLWLAIAFLSYVICLSGVVYNLIHTMPVFRFEQDSFGKMFVKEYFMRSQRSQYGGEGYIVSVLSFMIGAAFLALAKIDYLVKGDIARKAAIAGLCVLIFVGINAYVTIYRFKQPWYSNSFMPPSSFTKGPMWRDQGNNI